MRALALLALCLPATALAGTPLDKYEGSIGEVQIDGVVELPLYGGVYGDELPYVLVNFGEDDEGAWLFRVKLGEPDVDVANDIGEQFGGGVKTKNKKFFASLGKKKDEASYGLGGKQQTTHIDEIHLAEGLVLRDVDAGVAAFDSAPLAIDSPVVPTVFGDISLFALGLPVAWLCVMGDLAERLPEGAAQGVPLLPISRYLFPPWYQDPTRFAPPRDQRSRVMREQIAARDPASPLGRPKHNS